jgi:hypothetical protein
MIMWKIFLACLVVFNSKAPIADSDVTSSMGNPSASATITMTGILDE